MLLQRHGAQLRQRRPPLYVPRAHAAPLVRCASRVRTADPIPDPCPSPFPCLCFCYAHYCVYDDVSGAWKGSCSCSCCGSGSGSGSGSGCHVGRAVDAPAPLTRAASADDRRDPDCDSCCGYESFCGGYFGCGGRCRYARCVNRDAGVHRGRAPFWARALSPLRRSINAHPLFRVQISKIFALCHSLSLHQLKNAPHFQSI